MDAKRLTGPNAGSLKYDVLTALSVTGLHSAPGQQISLHRLSSILTARYNWGREELSLGQRDMARMWNVHERTVKREIKRWTDSGLLICLSPGVRGRVALYRLNLTHVFEISEPHWPCVGTDFVARMDALRPVARPVVVPLAFAPTPAPAQTPAAGWDAVRTRLHATLPDKFEAWIAPLKFISDDGRFVTLQAPSTFAARYLEVHLMSPLTAAIATGIGPGRRLVLQTA